MCVRPLAPFVVASLAFATPAFAGGHPLKGTWHGDDGETLVITVKKGMPFVKSFVSNDEKANIHSQRVSGEGFTWTYSMPSTGWVVTFVVTDIAPERFESRWSNDHDMAGDEGWTRVK